MWKITHDGDWVRLESGTSLVRGLEFDSLVFLHIDLWCNCAAHWLPNPVVRVRISRGLPTIFDNRFKACVECDIVEE